MGPSRAATLKEIVQEMNVGTMFDTKGEVRNPFELATSFQVDIPSNHLPILFDVFRFGLQSMSGYLDGAWPGSMKMGASSMD